MRRSCYSLLILMVILMRFSAYPSIGNAQGPEIREYQSLATHGASGWEYFSINGKHYLAAANYRNDSSTLITSPIYEYGTGFGGGTVLQSIPTSGAQDWEYFMIGSDHYLALANARGATTYNLNSKIYRWNGTIFEEFQPIPTFGAVDWEYFMIGADHYLAVANHYTSVPGTYNADSKIYKWKGSSFEEIQSIATHEARRWEYFSIGDDHFLAVANKFNDSIYQLDSKIYKWNGSSFDEFQSIATVGAYDWEYFMVGNDHYLAMANRQLNASEFNTDSKIYKWNGTNFSEFQSIATIGATDWQYFTLSSHQFLALSNSTDSLADNGSRFFQWNGTNFVEFKSISTQGGFEWTYFTIGNDTFLALASFGNSLTVNIDSPIFLVKYMVFAPFIVK